MQRIVNKMMLAKSEVGSFINVAPVIGFVDLGLRITALASDYKVIKSLPLTMNAMNCFNAIYL